MKTSPKLIAVILAEVLGFLVIALAIVAVAFNWFNINGSRFSDAVVLSTPPATTEPTAEPVPVVIDTKEPTATPTLEPNATPTPEPTATPEPTPTPYGYFGDYFAGRFTDGQIIQTETTYKSKDVSVTVTKVTESRLVYYVTDVYFQRIECFRTAYVTNDNAAEWTRTFAKEANAVVAVNGDYMTKSSDGWIVRNGIELRSPTKGFTSDLCVIYYDGTMETYDYREEIDAAAITARYPYQIFYFGPALLNADGTARTDFPPARFRTENPRTAIGYFEPGHYCFITVLGTRDNSDEKSDGITLDGLAQLFADLGCTTAYNLDGGGSCGLYYMGTLEGHNTRKTSDILYIGEVQD